MLTICPACGTEDLRPVVEVDSVPVFCNVLWPSRNEALLAPRADIRLVHCRQCRHFFNAAFDPTLTEYTPAYENSLHFSDRFNRYAKDLAQRLVAAYDLRGKDLIELGCGRGDFLKMLCQLGRNRGVGFDQSWDPQAGDPATGTEVRFVEGFLTWDHPQLPVDFLCCRHVLEHLPDPLRFLTDLREWLGEGSDTVLYFEVPNALFTFERGGIWDLIYEHASYFTIESLVTLFARAGLPPHSWGEAFGGQYLFVLAKVSKGHLKASGHPGIAPGILGASVASFRPRFWEEVNAWKTRMVAAGKEGTRFALWGGGSKGITFMNLVEPGSSVEFVVDINSRKQGKFVPGTGHQVFSPDALVDVPPQRVIVSNPIYLQEVEAELQSLGVDVRAEPI